MGYKREVTKSDFFREKTFRGKIMGLEKEAIWKNTWLSCCDGEHCSLPDTGDSEGQELTIGLNPTLVSLACAVLLLSLTKKGRTHILPDFTGQLYHNTAPEIPTWGSNSPSNAPFSSLVSDESIIPLSRIISNLRWVAGAYFHSQHTFLSTLPDSVLVETESGKDMWCFLRAKNPPLPPHPRLSLYYQAALARRDSELILRRVLVNRFPAMHLHLNG